MKLRDYMLMTGAVCVLATGLRAFALEAETAAVTEEGGQDAAGKKDDKGFDILVRAMSARGSVEVMNPDVGAFAPVVNSKAYPLGSVFRTKADGEVSVYFSGSESVQMLANTEIVALASDNPKARCVKLVAGRIKTSLRDNLLEGQFCVETPNASCKNMAGRAEFSLAMDGENEVFEAKVITGTARMEGPQYTFTALRAANTVNVLTMPNRSLSVLTGVSGDYKITLDNETTTPVVYDMSPKAVVKIWRDMPAGGGRLAVSTLVVTPTGQVRHRFAYVVGRGDIFKDGNPVIEQGDAEQEPDLPALIPAAGEKEKEKDSKKPEKPAEEEEEK